MTAMPWFAVALIPVGYVVGMFPTAVLDLVEERVEAGAAEDADRRIGVRRRAHADLTGDFFAPFF